MDPSIMVAAVVAALIFGLANGYAACHFMFSRRKEPKVISRCALRRQILQTYLDVDFNILEGESLEEIRKKIAFFWDVSGLGYETVKFDVEKEQEAKKKKLKAL